MNGQDRNLIEEIIQSVRDTGEQVISLDEVGIQVFRNLYHVAKTIEPDLDVEIVEKGKTIRIYRG